MKLRGLKNQVWVTSAVTDDDAKKSIVLANSLRRVLSNRGIAVVASGKVNRNLRDQLHYEFDHVVILEDDRNTANLKLEDFAKLTALTLKSFDKCIFVSPNMMFMKNSDQLFDDYEASFFASPKNDNLLPIFVYKPSLENYSVLMKSLGTRNGKPVDVYIKNWFCNQCSQEEMNLDPKYNKKIALANGILAPARTETAIVNFVDDPFACKDWKASSADFSLVDCHAVKTWMELYQKHVNTASIETIAANDVVEYKQEPIAIVGMSCRFPGSNNLEEFWNLLLNGEDGTGNPPDFRWLREQSSRNRPDCRKTNAGFLKVPVDEFDAKFFGISPKEVLYMDPQHRLLHELIWEGLEDAAIDPLKLRGSNGGVFMGSWTNDFKDILNHAGVSEFYRTYMGNSIGAAAARISFLLGLTGPSVATESGCSSAMVAVHMAVRSLLLGETNLALAAGVNLLLHPFDKDEMPMVISPEGRCKTFDAKADGFSRAEGCGVLVLKKLSDAVKDGDHIWALIRGTGVSQEGVSRSMGTPTVHCESLAMEQALKNGGIDPGQVSYVEAHGTGTVVGDPMEVAAIAKAYHSKNRKEPLVIGSVKTNVGHTESCSGITGIMKVALAMRHSIIPPHRNFETLNPNINLDSVPAVIPLQPVEWKKEGSPRLAGVSSFGITGTDAHAIIEEPPVFPLTDAVTTLERPQHVLKISTKTEEALDILLGRYLENIESSEELLADIAYTANCGRANFNWRAVAIGKTKEDIVAQLKQNQVTKHEAQDDVGKICFLFTGQGSQYPGMAKQLYETSPVFRMHFDYCDRLLNEMYNISIRDVLWESGDDSKNAAEVSRTIYSQTSIFCVEYALLKLWESWGVKPDYALGHSLGEFAAAVCAGILTPEDAIKLVAERSRLIDDLPRGKMLVIKADKDVVAAGMKKFAGGDSSKILDYAAVNSAQQTVVAGDSNVVLEFAEYCTNKMNLKSIVLDASHAFHSKHMDPMLEDYRKVAETIRSSDDDDHYCKYISGMKGKLVEASTIDAEYWVQHTRQKVDFLNASKVSTELGCQIFIEIGPQPVLSALTMMNNDGNPLTCLPSLKRNQDDWDTILQTLAKLYLKGVAINWGGFDELYNRKKVRLPHYPFIGKKFWPDMMATTGNTIHPLLGSLIPNASSTKLFQNGLNLRCLEYVKDHAIGSNVIFPGAGYLEMCLAAGHATAECCTDSLSRPSRPMKVENLGIQAPLALEESKTSQVQLVLSFNSSNGDSNNDWNDMSIKIFHRVDANTDSIKWLPHANASFTPLPSSEDKNVDFNVENFQKLRLQPSDDKLIAQTYDKLASVGLKFGPIFQSLEMVWKDENNGMLAKVKKIPSAADSHQYILHPVVLDAMIQAVMMQKHSDKIKKKLYVPISIQKFVWLANAQGEDLYIYSKELSDSSNQAILVDDLGTVIAAMSGIELIDTTVKAVESVLEQQTSVMPDLWEETWRGKLGPLQHRVPDDIISENPFSAEFRQHINKTFNVPDENNENIFTKLEEYVYYFILNCFYECNWTPQVETKFSLDEFINALQIQTEHTKFVKYFLEILVEENILRQPSHNEWEIASMPPTQEEVVSHLSLPVFTDDLVKKFDPTRLLTNVGKNLKGILRGIQSPLTILFPEDNKNNPSVSGFYNDYGKGFNVLKSVSDIQTKRLTSWMEKMKTTTGESKLHVRILEVGAGTGIFTSAVLPVLEEAGVDFEYTYSDISPAFFSAAEKRFEKYVSKMKFKKLNIEEDPIGQGYAPQYYDYVIASDVIHATKDLRQTLENIRRILRVGGTVDIMEQIQKNRIVTLIFGITEGFWRFSDFRSDHCILTQAEWENVLRECGFANPITFPSFNDRHGYITSWSTVHKTEHSECELAKTTPSWMVFSTQNCKLADFIRKQLEFAGRHVITVQPGSEFKAEPSQNFFVRDNYKEDFESVMGVLKTRKTQVEGIIYLWALDKERTDQSKVLQPYFYISQTLFSLKQKVNPRLCAVTQGVAPIGDNDLSHFHPSTIWGFTKTLRNENTDMNCRCISISSDRVQMSDKEMAEVYQEVWSDDKEPQVAYQNGSRHVARFQPVKFSTQDLTLPQGTNRFQLVLPEAKNIGDLQFGSLDTFQLAELDVEIQVKASALNFKDVLNILKPTEEFKDSNAVGFDFAGVITQVGSKVSRWKMGDAVFGVNINGNALPNHIRMNEDAVLPIPDHLTFCDAATLPAVFATSYYCLVDIAKMKRGETVLIHTASGGVGLSAIELCQNAGVNIIATAGSKRKRAFLKSLGVEHIFNSRTTEYGDQILEVTNGRGVDIVINSLTSEGFKEATIKCCAKNARFVEMSKLSIWSEEEMRSRRPDISYTIVDLTTLSDPEWKRLMSNLNKYLEQGLATPMPYVRFDAISIKEALQYLQKAKHVGKVVCVMPEIKVVDGKMEVVTPMFSERSTYLVTGGLGGIGFEVAKWMVQKGAKNVFLAGRSSPKSNAQDIISQMNSHGANVTPVQLDVGNWEQCKQLLESIKDKKLPPLRGVMHAAGTLSDGLIANQDWSKLSSTFNTKIRGTLNLHELLKDTRLEHFVLFSSIASLYGSPGQSNHAAGNNFEDTFAHYRHSMGLCATTINWGQWGEVGIATEVDLPGMRALSTLQGISALEHCMKTQRLQTTAMNMESFVLFSKLSPQTAVYLDERIWKAGSSSSTSMTIKSDEFWQQYDSQHTEAEKLDMIKFHLKDILRKILKLDAEEPIEDESNFQEMGVDSLMFVEIKNAVQALLGDRVVVSASALRDCNNIRLLSSQLIKLIEGEDTAPEEQAPTPEEVIALIREDCILPEHITAVGRPVKSISEIRKVLLTGATGTLGPYVLKELVGLSQISEVYCLVRPSKNNSVQERLQKVLQARGLQGVLDSGKVKFVEGNISKERLGMSESDWDELSQNVDAIFHSAVRADHTQYYKKRENNSGEDVRSVNIGGTKNVLEFACSGQVKHIYCASSLLSVATADPKDDTLSESWPSISDFDGVTKFAYAISKFVGDILMKEAVFERGLPVKVFRFPILSGDSRTGRFNLEQNHLMLRYFYIMKTGIMPTNPFPLNLLPADLCASISTQLFFNESLSSDIFNISHPQPDLDQEFPTIATNLGFHIDFVEFSEFVDRLFSEPDDSTFSLFKGMYKNQDDLMALYTVSSSLQKWLEGIEDFWVSKKVTTAIPGVYKNLERSVHTLERDLRYAQREGWFEKFGLTKKD